MKRIILFLLLTFSTLATWAYDFCAMVPGLGGQMLYYNIVDGNAQVTYAPLYSEYPPLGTLQIPSTVTHNGTTYTVTSIGDNAFAFRADLVHVTIPNTVTSIGDYAFHACTSIGIIELPNSVTSLGHDAFSYCQNMSSIQLSNSLVEIKEATFYDCRSLRNVSIPNSVTSIGDKAFAFCDLLESVYIEDNGSLTNLGEWAFHGCYALKQFGCIPDEVVIPESLTTIPREAFSFCSSITSITIPESITSIEAAAFAYCTSLPDVTIPESVTFIDSATFYGCLGLTSMTIPNSVDSIAVDAFWGCANLTFMIIPNSVTGIGQNSFNDCPNLTIFDFTDLNNFTRTYAGNPRRVVKCRIWGERLNSIVQISDGDYSVVASEDYEEHHVPAAYIPDTNYIFINNDNNSWEARNIVLTDCQDAFYTPVSFTANHAYYTRNFTDGNRSTLYLPFKAAVPDNLGVYEVIGFSSDTIFFNKPADTSIITAYTPYLVGYNISKSLCQIAEPNAEFPATEEDAGAVCFNNRMDDGIEVTFHGTVKRTDDLPANCYGYKDGYFVQSGGSAHVNPFRCYFSISQTSGTGAGTHQLCIDTEPFEDGYLDIQDVEAPTERPIHYSNDVFDLMGRTVRKNADNLRGLPKGVYIWRGKKHLVY